MKTYGVFGKGVISPDHPACKDTYTLGKYLGTQDCHIIHGGYLGLMNEISEGFNATAVGKKNQGVPMALFDDHYVPKANCTFLPQTNTIATRADGIIQNADEIIVLPAGGIGTITEIALVLNENLLYQKFGREVKPIHFIGDIWRLKMEHLCEGVTESELGFCQYYPTVADFVAYHQT